MKLYGIIGAGGFGREVYPVAQEMLEAGQDAEERELVFVVEDLEQETTANGHRVISDAAFLAQAAGSKYFNIAIADGKARERIAGKMLVAGIQPFTVAARNSICYEGNTVGVGAILCAFTSITSNVRIGRFFHANIYSYVAHDCTVGDFVTFAPRVHCNGNIVIEDYAYVGTAAVIKQGTPDKPVVIGKGAVVGMGAVVTKSVAPFTTVVGNPAAELKKK
ncbi:MAG: acetyltransferase [Candidatus Hydrogenedentes bacterium]|nr:acetyltransferase [Candidatus Hydrogenedentota bacterium]MBI3119155.1 acetyltransferase [Candidatus Hydrogenedentota bacterium]